jgi:hypothetical protein
LIAAMSPRTALALLALLLGSGLTGPALSQVVWREGFLVYTPLYDQMGNYQPNGTGYFVAQATIPNPPQPVVGQTYYVSVVMSAIASPPTGRFMAPHLQLPSGTTVVADPAIPLRCFYRPMSGTGGYVEFTNQALVDQSFGANLRIAGCPQPSAAALPSYLVGDGGSGLLIDRRDPQSGGNQLWPMGSYAGYEFLVPVVSNRAMNAIANDTLFRAPTLSIQGDLGQLWAYPELRLLVHPAGGGVASADMAVTELSVMAPLVPGNRRVRGRCTNLGPDAAQNATCTFQAVPPGATSSCSPVSPQASLALNALIECVTEFPATPNGATVELLAGSSTPDPNTLNNGIGIFTTPATGAVLVFASSFEP